MRRILLILFVMLLLPQMVLAQRESLTQEDINRIASTVVYIETELDGRPISSGSGTLINETGLIYTNRHVIEDSEDYDEDDSYLGDDFHIFLLGDMGELPQPSYYASLIYVSDEIDFAILQIDRDDRGRDIDPEDLSLPFLPTTNDTVGYGEPIYIFGYPDIGDGYLVLTQGSITTIENGEIEDERLPIWYRTDAEMSSGNSGGLVVNTRGEFIGIPTWVRKAESTLGQLGGILPYPAIRAVLANAENEEEPDNNNEREEDFGSVVVENNSDETICYLYFSPITSSDWGTDYLGRDTEIEPGDTFEFEAQPGTYDLKLEDCDKRELDDQRELVLEDNLRVTYADSGIEDEPENRAEVEQTLTIDIQRIEYDAEVEGEEELGIMVYAYIRAAGYNGVPLRAAAFYYWADDEEPMSGENALEESRTSSGNLTIQTVITPEYDDTEWDGFWFWMPYSSFPDFRGDKAEAFVQLELGVEDENFTAFSDDAFFTLEAQD
jgi:S1-C subfamily serine protease